MEPAPPTDWDPYDLGAGTITVWIPRRQVEDLVLFLVRRSVGFDYDPVLRRGKPGNNQMLTFSNTTVENVTELLEEFQEASSQEG